MTDRAAFLKSKQLAEGRQELTIGNKKSPPLLIEHRDELLLGDGPEGGVRGASGLGVHPLEGSERSRSSLDVITDHVNAGDRFPVNDCDGEGDHGEAAREEQERRVKKISDVQRA
jgi:hypothetical protein